LKANESFSIEGSSALYLAAKQIQGGMKSLMRLCEVFYFSVVQV